jgi:CDP-glucose 4,6-dehydratase
MARVVGGSRWLDRPVLVTGATGLLGGWVASALLGNGARVVALVRDLIPRSFLETEGLFSQLVVVRGELGDLPLLVRVMLEYEIDTIFHLAAQSQVGVARRGPYHTMEANVRGTYSLLEAARRVGNVSAILVASSDKAYGEQPVLPYSESTPLDGRNPYDASKAAADLLARSYATSYKLPVIVSRCGNLFGGGDLNWNRLIPGTIRSLLAGKSPVIRSDGTPIRDYLYVADAVSACLMSAERAATFAGEAFNFSLEQPLSVLAVVDMIRAELGSDLRAEVRADTAGEIARQYLLAEKARGQLGWRPRFTMDGGLRETIAWYRRYLARD